MKSFGRSDGSSAVAAAAYRAGERLRDERSGRTHDHSERRDVLYKSIVLPSDLSAESPGWAADRASLWNLAEQAEPRRNARVAREFLVALPHELDLERQRDLTHAFAQELSDRYRFGVDIAIHSARDFPGSDPRNVHAHLLTTTREVGLGGLRDKTTLEWNESRRAAAGLGHSVHELLHVRQRWAESTNQALAQANVAARVDHRSLAAQGIDREPIPRIPRAAFELERRGDFSHVADRLRHEYAARVTARQERSQTAPAPPDLEATRRAAREAWLRHRQLATASPTSVERGADDDLTR
jgi:hypothetical protein